MGLPPVPTRHQDSSAHRQRIAEVVNGVTSFQFDDSRVRTDAEIVAGVTPVNYAYAPGDSRRSVTDVTGATFVTTQLQALFDAAGQAALAASAATGIGTVAIVTIYAGIYKVTRLYLRYSNVWVYLMPGAIIQQNRSGTGLDTIVDANTAGVAPAYAVIHINPLTYVAAPASAVTAITNVRIYGGGTVKGPYTTTGAYNGFSLGIVSNDCNDCVIEDITVRGCRAENILHNPSGWNTAVSVHILDNEITEGGEVGVTNARNFSIVGNYVHDSWMQNGVGGNGDGGVVAQNQIASMYGAGMAFGGSGAADIGQSRNIIYTANVVRDCNTGTGGGAAIFMTDDGATTVPKYLKVIGNTFAINAGNVLVAADYASGHVEFSDNTLESLTGTDPTMFAVLSGGATYHLRNNTFRLGSGNAVRCVDVQSGTPTVILDEGQYYDPTIATDIQGPDDFDIRHNYNGTFTATLGGVVGTVTTTMRYSVKGQGPVTLYLSGITGTSNAAAVKNISGLPARITPARNENFIIPVTDNSAPATTAGLGLIQVKTDGTIDVYKDTAGGTPTNGGTFGITGPYVITYTKA